MFSPHLWTISDPQVTRPLEKNVTTVRRNGRQPSALSEDPAPVLSAVTHARTVRTARPLRSAQATEAPWAPGAPRKVVAARWQLRWHLGATLVAMALALSACGSVSSDESCGQFRSQSTSAQKATVTKLVEAHGEANPSPAEVDTAWASAEGYCFLHGSSDMISGIYS